MKRNLILSILLGLVLAACGGAATNSAHQPEMGGDKSAKSNDEGGDKSAKSNDEGKSDKSNKDDHDDDGDADDQ